MTSSNANSFTFKENILTRCFVSLFFGLAALIIALAGVLKLKDGLLWAIPTLAAAGLALVLFYYVVISVRSRQVVTVTPTTLTSRSLANGTTQIAWQDITDIREVQTRLERARSMAPLVEVMLSLYFNLPLLASGDRQALLVFEAGSEKIGLRQHLIYPHRLDELRLAAIRYAPSRNGAERFLKVNTNN